MRTELRMPFTYGFVLTEQELRRTHYTMVQQMKRTGKGDFSSFFEVRYKNGVRAEKASLDEITAENNRVKWMIQELKMALFSNFPLRETQIEIEFRVPPPPPSRESTSRPYSVQYYIVGNERDWVFLTSSQLDDRLANIKQWPIFYYGVVALAIGFVMLIVFLTILFSTGSSKLPLGYEIVALLVSGWLMIGGVAAMYGLFKTMKSVVPLVPVWTIKNRPRWYNLDNENRTHLRVFLLSLEHDMFRPTIGENGDDYRGRLRSHSPSVLY